MNGRSILHDYHKTYSVHCAHNYACKVSFCAFFRKVDIVARAAGPLDPLIGLHVALTLGETGTCSLRSTRSARIPAFEWHQWATYRSALVCLPLIKLFAFEW